MSEFNFSEIAPRLGSDTAAFEELCCQIARRKAPSNAEFFRLHGAGGDGGVHADVLPQPWHVLLLKILDRFTCVATSRPSRRVVILPEVWWWRRRSDRRLA